MIVTSDSTALSVIITDANTGTSTPINAENRDEAVTARRPSTRPITTNISTGTAIVPIAPSGSRMKILISSQVSLRRPLSMISIPNRVAGQLQEPVLEIRKPGPEVGSPDPVRGKTMDHVRDQVGAVAENGEPAVLARDRRHARNRPKVLLRRRLVCDERDRSLGAVPRDERRRRADVDDPAVIDDRHAIAQSLGFLHQMRRQEHGLAALADAAHQLPNRAPRLRVEPGGELVEKHQFRIVDERERDEQALLLAA